MKIILLDDFGPFVGLGLLLLIVITFATIFLTTLIKGKNIFYKRLSIIILGVLFYCFLMWRILS